MAIQKMYFSIEVLKFGSGEVLEGRLNSYKLQPGPSAPVGEGMAVNPSMASTVTSKLNTGEPRKKALTSGRCWGEAGHLLLQIGVTEGPSLEQLVAAVDWLGRAGGIRQNLTPVQSGVNLQSPPTPFLKS